MPKASPPQRKTIGQMSHEAKSGPRSRLPARAAKAQNSFTRAAPNRSATWPSKSCSTALPAMKQASSEAMRSSSLPSAAPYTANRESRDCSKAAVAKTANRRSGARARKPPTDVASPPCGILGRCRTTASTIRPQRRKATTPIMKGGQPSVPTKRSDSGPMAKPTETMEAYRPITRPRRRAGVIEISHVSLMT